MKSVNKVILVGNVGKEPEIKSTKDGRSIASFSLATQDSYKAKSGEYVKTTEWHKVTFFGALADVVASYVTKGSPLYIEGSIKTEKWTDKEGKDRYTTNIIGKELVLLGSKQKAENNEQMQLDLTDADVPF